jgi:hypothetical protein
MTMTDVRSPERSSAAGPSLVEALERPRYEILPLDGIADEVLEHVPPGRKITLTSSPSRGLEATLGLAEQLAPRGYEVDWWPTRRTSRTSSCACGTRGCARRS